MKKLKVIITGHQGFIGSWTALKFHNEQYEVYGIDNRSSFGERLFDRANLSRIMEKQFETDIADYKSIQAIVNEVQPDIVVNLAGQAIVPRAFNEPFYTFATNTLGTLAVLESARNCSSVSSVISVTSDKVYENKEQIWPYREIDQLGGKDIYSVSKSSAESISRCYAKTHIKDQGLNVQTVRLGNVVGGGDWSVDRLVPDLIRSIVQKKTFSIRYLKAVRPFQHVLDVVDAIYNIGLASMANKVTTGEAWNLGPKSNSHAEVSEVIDMCKEIWPDLKIKESENKIKEDMFLSVDVSKLKKRFGAPKYTSQQALQKTFNWYHKFINNDSLDELINSEFSSYDNKQENI